MSDSDKEIISLYVQKDKAADLSPRLSTSRRAQIASEWQRLQLVSVGSFWQRLNEELRLGGEAMLRPVAGAAFAATACVGLYLGSIGITAPEDFHPEDELTQYAENLTLGGFLTEDALQ